MQKIKDFYRKYQTWIENGLFPVLLILYPFVQINQGIDVSDTAYSLSNFAFFGEMKGTWMTATFLANVLGNLLMKLPSGDTLLGIYCYTTLLQSATAVLVYASLRRRIPAPVLFFGEIGALGLCWCPSTILYNYLTYLLLMGGILLLYRGICLSLDDGKEKEGRQPDGSCGLPENGGKVRRRKQVLCYVGAGVLLGANVAVRMPNAVQAMLILALWYGVLLAGKENRRHAWGRLAVDTLWCVLGYLLGFGVPLLCLSLRYGAGAYPSMVQTMFAMTEKAVDYKPTAMLQGMFGDYARGLFWLLFAGIGILAGAILFVLQRRLCDKRGAAVLCRVVYSGIFLVLLRFYWGKGVFSFRYYEYSSIYYPAVLLLMVFVFVAVWTVFSRKTDREQKALAVLLLVQAFVTPLGSNNDLYPILNALFLVLPFTLWMLCELGKGREVSKRMLWQIPAGILCLFVLIQSIGFHAAFAFQDGVDGTVRDRLVNEPQKARGVYTTEENGALLEELAVYAQDAGLAGREAIFYGEIPGLGYFLDMPSALSTFWPALDSYRMQEFEADMEQVRLRAEADPGGLPVIFLSAADAAYLSEDADAMNWFGVDKEALSQDEKLRQLGEFLKENGYRETFCNASYAVYEADGG